MPSSRRDPRLQRLDVFLGRGSGLAEKQFNDQDEDVYDTQAEEREILPEAGALPARSLRPLEVVIMVPGTYADARHGVDALEKGSPLLSF